MASVGAWFSRSSLRSWRSVGVGVGLIVLGGCTLINQLDTVQCASNSDCASRGGDFRQSVCGIDGICVALVVNKGGAGGQGGGSGASGAGAGGAGGAAGEAGMSGESGAGGGSGGGAGLGGEGGGAGSGAECATNKDCLSKIGGQVRCQSGACVALTSKQCTKTVGDILDEPDQIFGVMTPQFGVNAKYGASYQTAVETALKEYKTKLQGSALTIKAPYFIFCDEIQDPAAVADHLINKVGVKTIIGPVWGGAAKKVLPLVIKSNTVALLGSNDDPSLLETTSTSNQVWSCKPNRSQIQGYWKSAVGELEKIIKKKPSPPGTLRVAFVVAGDSSSQALASQIVDKTEYNGKSQADNAAENNFFRIDYGNFQEETLTYASIADSIVNHPSKTIPNLIVMISSGDGPLDLGGAIENVWPSQEPRPYYLFVGARDGIEQLFGTQPPERAVDTRSYSLDIVRSDNVQANFQTFRGAYQAANGGTTPRADAEYFYDCFWLNQFAIYNATNQGQLPTSSVDGALFSTKGPTSFNSPGTPAVVGGAGVNGMLDLLNNNGDPDLEGAGSSLEFDLTSKTPKAKGGLSCGKSLKLIASGLEFDPDNGSVSGTSQCP